MDLRTDRAVYRRQRCRVHVRRDVPPDFGAQADSPVRGCGAEPIAVIDGAESLTPAGAEERSTLARLGLGGSTRLACQARVQGPCVVSLTPTRASEEERAPDRTFSADPEVHRIVILGNG